MFDYVFIFILRYSKYIYLTFLVTRYALQVLGRFLSRRSSSCLGSQRDGVPSSCCVPTLTFNISAVFLSCLYIHSTMYNGLHVPYHS